MIQRNFRLPSIVGAFYLQLLFHLLQLSAVSSCSSCLVSSVIIKAGSTALALKEGKIGGISQNHVHHVQSHHNHYHRYHHQRNHIIMGLVMNQISNKFGIGGKILSKANGKNYVQQHGRRGGGRGGLDSVLTYIALRQLSTHYGCQNNMISPQSISYSNPYSYYHQGMFLTSNDKEEEEESKAGMTNKDNDDLGSISSEEDKDMGGRQSSSKDNVSASMVGAIGIYKNFISPLLPPACRFLPTCSQYGVQAIEEFGPSKGAILTAWRLLRCSPFGGRGYDPPKWPPVPYNYGSY